MAGNKREMRKSHEQGWRRGDMGLFGSEGESPLEIERRRSRMIVGTRIKCVEIG
jgi:hypothetical protein